MPSKHTQRFSDTFKQEALDRFKLTTAQFFATYRYKNLWWDLNWGDVNNAYIGYGDLRNSDIRQIQKALKDGEEFVGWHEHHGSKYQTTKTPMIRITNTQVLHREDIIAKEGT